MGGWSGRTNPDTRIISMPAVGRLRLGISCVGTGFLVIRIGPDSALCQNLGKCTPDELANLTQEDVAYLAIARSGSGFFGFVDGHGTMDTYAYTGSGRRTVGSTRA